MWSLKESNRGGKQQNMWCATKQDWQGGAYTETPGSCSHVSTGPKYKCMQERICREVTQTDATALLLSKSCLHFMADLVCWMGDLLLSFIGCISWTKHQSPFPCFLLFFSHSLSVPLPLAILLACSFLPVQGRWVIFLCYSLGEKRELRQGAVAQLELKALIIVSASISPSVHPSSDQVSVLTVLPWWWQRCRQPANALLLFMFPY